MAVGFRLCTKVDSFCFGELEEEEAGVRSGAMWDADQTLVMESLVSDHDIDSE